ncbi:MAG: right-handed parallel beta-helix repeat-containing protein, partial [Phycisphaerae bacterium]|nr:right-handed parallel beta-helix repeat-containing protein [Phycisphaerae bacterium]
MKWTVLLVFVVALSVMVPPAQAGEVVAIDMADCGVLNYDAFVESGEISFASWYRTHDTATGDVIAARTSTVKMAMGQHSIGLSAQAKTFLGSSYAGGAPADYLVGEFEIGKGMAPGEDFNRYGCTTWTEPGSGGSTGPALTYQTLCIGETTETITLKAEQQAQYASLNLLFTQQRSTSAGTYATVIAVRYQGEQTFTTVWQDCRTVASNTAGGTLATAGATGSYQGTWDDADGVDVNTFGTDGYQVVTPVVGWTADKYSSYAGSPAYSTTNTTANRYMWTLDADAGAEGNQGIALDGEKVVEEIQITASGSGNRLYVYALSAVTADPQYLPGYYVDFEGGNDADDGTSPATAWQHCPGDPNATGLAASTVIVGGDTLYFRGGSTYVVSASGIVLKSGEADARVTYDGTTWGDGSRCLITGNNAVVSNEARCFTDSGAARSHINIRGFSFRDIGGYAEDDPIWQTSTPVTDPPSGFAIRLHGGGSSISIDDCLFAECGQWQNIQPMSGIGGVSGCGVSLQNNSDVFIGDCDFTRVKVGVSIKATTAISGITVQDCSFHNYMNWLIDIAPRRSGAAISDILIDGCLFYDYKEFDRPNWQGFGEKPHQNAIFLRASGMASTWSNIVIRNSMFHSDQSSDGGTASIYASEGPSFDVYNCAFLDDKHTNANINVGYSKVTPTQTVRIWNCTFVGSTRNIKIGGTPDVVDIRNNIFKRTVAYDVVQVKLAVIGSLTMDNNIIYGPDASRAVHDGVGYRTLAQWQSLSGQDANSCWADPLLTNVGVGAPSTWDITPTSSSPALGAGFDLS